MSQWGMPRPYSDGVVKTVEQFCKLVYPCSQLKGHPVVDSTMYPEAFCG